ncbi:MAG: PEP-CTERM sorting domain-containing protein [Acidobacteria bacterium]|nr:PEP-CTERM sorting domain-containing protein [Acidobacteriota bacterium]
MKHHLLFLALLALPAYADTFYSNLDPAPNFYNSGSARSISTADATFLGIAQGFRFTSGGTGVLNQIDLGVGFVPNFAGTLTVGLWSDGGTTVGTSLGSWNLTTTVQFGTSSSALTSVLTPGGPALTAGTSYFLTLSPRGTSGVWGAWNEVTTNANRFSSYDGGPWVSSDFGPLGAARLIGTSTATSVPEPTSILTLGGILVLAVRRRRRPAPAGLCQ